MSAIVDLCFFLGVVVLAFSFLAITKSFGHAAVADAAPELDLEADGAGVEKKDEEDEEDEDYEKCDENSEDDDYVGNISEAEVTALFDDLSFEEASLLVGRRGSSRRRSSRSKNRRS
jgi:hypothetical protein